MRRTLATTFIALLSLAAACGSGPKGGSGNLAKQPTDPKAVPTATLPAVLPTPIPAGTVTEGGITGQANSGPATYIIKSGDSGAKIASTLGVSLTSLQSYNSGIDWSNLKIGQELKVPPAPSPTPTTGPLRPATSTPSTSSSSTRTPTSTSGVATAAPATPAGTSSSGGAQSYTVQSGDTACKIATSFGVSLADLASANGTTASGLASLKIGQQLTIPSTRSASPGC